jgi:hypothetical protein
VFQRYRDIDGQRSGDGHVDSEDLGGCIDGVYRRYVYGFSPSCIPGLIPEVTGS